MSAKKPGLFGSLMVVLFGLVFIVFGYFVHQQRVPYADGVSATAKVTDVQERRGGNGPTYSAVFTFTAQDDRQVTVTESSSSSIRPHIGESVDVSYQAADPGGARIIPAHDWVSLICFAAGGLVVLLGLASFAVRLLAVALAVGLAITAWRGVRRASREAADPAAAARASAGPPA